MKESTDNNNKHIIIHSKTYNHISSLEHKSAKLHAHIIKYGTIQ